MKSNAPNLFKYAPKELAQDAMICWLIAWAGQGEDAGPEQEELRRSGRRTGSPSPGSPAWKHLSRPWRDLAAGARAYSPRGFFRIMLLRP